ncbi:MAG: DeoR/GlpR family DNA-binding transcription regulator [Pseudomonadota bacterium]|nr:DeoR/GlpR family DNA-binding transcription regulator [Pseudomonadota bacterium]
MRKLSGAEARGLRLAKLQGLVESSGAVPLRTAAELLQVSTMTLRRDLSAPGAPLACLGGYVVGSWPTGGAKYTLDAERDQHAPNKLLACRRAAGLVKDGDSLFIDCGTTMPHFAEALPPGISLDVVCYSLNIAMILRRRPNTQLMVLGGLYHPSSATFFSDEALHYLKRLGVDKAFISAGGVHPARGASCSNFNEVPIKQAAMESASESILVVDESKLGRLRPAFFSQLGAFSRIVVGGAPGPQRGVRFKRVELDIAV